MSILPAWHEITSQKWGELPMSNIKYDLALDWSDPFDVVQERRIAPRASANARVEMSVRAEKARGRFVGPAQVKELSLSGARVVTKHRVAPAQTVRLRISTEAFGLNEVVPQEFDVACYVRRVQPINARMNLVALEFDRSVADNMDFAFFVRQTQSTSSHDLATQG